MRNNTQVFGYEDYFNGLLSIVSPNELSDQLTDAIKQYALTFINVWNPKDFRYIGNEYTRNFIGADEKSKWEAIVMCWRKGNETEIHGHPDFASYTILSGELLIETFLPNGINTVKKEMELKCHAGESFFSIGNRGLFDNHIHRLTCLSDEAYSLHIYSDDARKGKIYSLAQ